MKITKLLLLLFLISCANKKTIIIAHRGASGYLPEHSLAGVAMAHAWGIDFIEPDVVMTKDNELIVMHDLTLDATTNVKSIFPNRARKDGSFYVIDFTLAEIKQLKLNERINPKTGKAKYPKRFPIEHNLFTIPTFEEYLQLIQGLNKSTGKTVGIYPEIKAPAFHNKEGYDLVRPCMTMLRKYGYEEKPEQIFIQSFDPKYLKLLKTKYKTKMPLIQLLAENTWGMHSGADYTAMKSKEGLREIKTYAVGVGAWVGQVASIKGDQLKATSLAKKVRDASLKLHVYTLRKDQLFGKKINSEKLSSYLIKEVKVTGIFTDQGNFFSNRQEFLLLPFF